MKKMPKTRTKTSAAAETKKAPKKTPATRKRAAEKAVAEDVHKFEASKSAKTHKPAARKTTAKAKGADLDNLGELPRSYGDDRIFVVAQEPHWLFCYWDYTLTDGLAGQVFLRHSVQGSAEREGEVRVPQGTNSWYLAVREADSSYQVELGYYDGPEWKMLVRSGSVLTPRDTLAGFGDPVFANMPFHLTFQQLVERLRGEMREGESLAETLARLQQRGDLPVGRLTPAQRLALDTLLGSQLGSLTSGDLGRFLSSPSASLFSGGFAPSSWGASWGAAAPSSWGEAPGGLSSGFLALFELLGSSWSSGALSSALSSWSSAAFSSWSSSAVSSWGQASWGAESSRLSSWSSAPRDFFMHVNAEVIFYGGTHPDAKVTVGGREIALRPDGTFRYHFVFPDGEFEIPVVATSPDGKETRRAVLRFERGTSREGDVGATAQPPLGEPMGKKR